MPIKQRPREEKQLTKGMRIFSGLTLMLFFTGIVLGLLAYFIFFQHKIS